MELRRAVKDTSELLLKMAPLFLQQIISTGIYLRPSRHVKLLISAPIAVDGEIECAMILVRLNQVRV